MVYKMNIYLEFQKNFLFILLPPLTSSSNSVPGVKCDVFMAMNSERDTNPIFIILFSTSTTYIMIGFDFGATGPHQNLLF